jgi:pimeloyl-ACP methyl ester carboxylesterase
MGAVKVTIFSLGFLPAHSSESAYITGALLTINAMSIENPYAEALAATAVRDRQVNILGSESHYWDYGPDDAPVTIVAVHGFRGEHHGLEPIVVQLAGLRVISPDLPGFGESTRMTESPHDVPGYSLWLAEFVNALGLPTPPVILGHSFGSIITACAVASGVTTAKLILINPIAAPALKGPKAFVTGLAVFYYRLGAWLPERLGFALLGSRLITRAVSEGMATAKDAALRRWIHGQHRTYFSRFSDRDTLLEAFRASTANNVMEYAARITVPTLLIAAANDPITTVADEEKLRDLLPNAELHVIAGVGHLIHYERPREAAEFLVKFVGAGTVAAPRR